nr:FAD-dependent monooxygenase [Antrihabitans stalactiti]
MGVQSHRRCPGIGGDFSRRQAAGALRSEQASRALKQPETHWGVVSAHGHLHVLITPCAIRCNIIDITVVKVGSSVQREFVDVVVVGARCAGTALAAPLARAGRTVVVLDRAAFPADTMSTHVLFPMGVNELDRLGALDKILALNPSRMTHLRLDLVGTSRTERFQRVGEIDYGISVPRIDQDLQLIAAAREAGADIREQCTVQDVIVEDGRAVGVRYFDGSGTVREVRARLVVGADGRHSTVANGVGEWEPYRRSRNGRGMVFRYMDDPAADTDWASTLWEGRRGDTIAFAFPGTPKGRLLVLFMGPRAEVAEARTDSEVHWARKVAEFPVLADRIAGATNQTAIRSTGQTHAYFRRSSGPGWALIGDAGHFKDPVLGQGMRDAMWMGRRLAEHVVDVLDDPRKLDAAARAWERARDLECLPTYHYGNLETRIPAPPPQLIASVVRNSSGTELSDIHQRLVKPHGVYTTKRIVKAGVATLMSRWPTPGNLLEIGELVTVEAVVRAELMAARTYRGRMRSLGPIVGEHRDDEPWSQPPRRPKPRAARSIPVAAQVAGIRPVSSDTTVFDLKRVDGEPWTEWTPGAHIDLHLPSGKVRQYSLSGDVSDRETLSVAVLREPEGRGGSVEIHDLAVGAAVAVVGPRNNFALDDATEYVFIAGGIGITPILTMIAAAENAGKPWRLLYRGRSAAHLPFGADLAERYGDKVTLSNGETDPRPDLGSWIDGLPAGSAVYSCGPNSLMEAVVETADRHPRVTAHIERFVPTESAPRENNSFEVELAQSNATVAVTAEMSMLDAIRGAVPDLPASCENGLCGSCEVAVLRGRPDHRDDIIGPAERTRTDIMYPCVSRSLDATLTIDA